MHGQSKHRIRRYCLDIWVHNRYAMLHTHTHARAFNGPFSGTTQVSRYKKGKTNLDFTEARDSEWQSHQLGHMQFCTSLQTNNHASTPPLSFFTGRMPFMQPNQQCQSTEGMHCYWSNILCPENVGTAWTSIMVIYLPRNYLSQLTKQQTLETEVVQFSATDKLWWNLQVLLDFWVVVSSADQSFGGVQCILWVGDSLTPRWSAYNSLIVRRESNDRWRRPCPFTVLQHPRCLPLHYWDTRVGGAKVNANDMTFDLVWPSTEKRHRMRWKQYWPSQQLWCDRYYHKISSITYGTGVQFWAQIEGKPSSQFPPTLSVIFFAQQSFNLLDQYTFADHVPQQRSKTWQLGKPICTYLPLPPL